MKFPQRSMPPQTSPLAEARYVFERLSTAEVHGDIIRLPSEIATDPEMSDIVAEENSLPSPENTEVPSRACRLQSQHLSLE